MKPIINTLKSFKRMVFYVVETIKVYAYDAIHFYKHSLSFGLINENRFLGAITLRAHVVEKGITMPNRRYNFGEANLLDLIQLCNAYIQKGYNTDRTLFRSAISVIFEYELLHMENGKSLPSSLTSEIESLHKLFPNYHIDRQLLIDKATMFLQGDFKYTAENRHSIRNFCGQIPMQKVVEAIQLAQTSPTACNRQPMQVFVVENTFAESDIFHQILAIQNGNRGFGDKADKLLIVTVNPETYLYPQERHAIYIDGGIYTMNLLYSLHYYSISACTLNTSFTKKHDIKLRQLLHTDNAFIAIIAIGDCPDIINVPSSDRKTANHIILR